MRTLRSTATAVDEVVASPYGERFVRTETSVPHVDLALLADALADEPMVYWAPPGAPATLGLGATLRLSGRGDARFSMLRDAASTLPAWAELYCGFSFSPGSRAPFGDALALLPRFLLRDRGDETVLSTVLDRGRPDDAAELHAQLAKLGDAMHRIGLPRKASRFATDGPHEAAQFQALVERARDAIRGGAFDKVVVHRQTRLPASTQTPGGALAFLRESQPSSTGYAFRLDGTTFLGATPERLVRRTGNELRADVLAGSLPRDAADRGPSALLESAKDRGEHELTRAAIAAVLQPLCSRYVEHGPRVQTLPHLYHLHTTVDGELAAPTHVLDLVAALHPTPAVGGSPRREALAFIAAAEPEGRGWYAAPIGWFKPDGDGDFSVALRCALVERDAVTLYAGAGIVAGSEPARELAETASKRRAIANALGLEFL
ncbi:MAG: isochorismate synthase [Polyangia bacterium]